VRWGRGAEVFGEWLVDHETACNVGNWMWLSCTAFSVCFRRKTDVEGAFAKHFAPELEKFGQKYIYKPWKAPIADQKRWGLCDQGRWECSGREWDEGVFNTDVGFSGRRQVCIDKLKKAYAVGMYGDDERVKDGRWKGISGIRMKMDG
jgi:cryptochrome